jgi:predicted transcriptional regulator
MTRVDNPADCLERAKMHDQLAAATDDAPARLMHQAMAAEFRRRAAELRTMDMPPPTSGPRLEMYVASR